VSIIRERVFCPNGVSLTREAAEKGSFLAVTSHIFVQANLESKKYDMFQMRNYL